MTDETFERILKHAREYCEYWVPPISGILPDGWGCDVITTTEVQDDEPRLEQARIYVSIGDYLDLRQRCDKYTSEN